MKVLCTEGGSQLQAWMDGIGFLELTAISLAARNVESWDRIQRER